jgi:hypothetical protein
VIVYGDTELRMTLGELLGSMENRLLASDGSSIDDLRTLLVRAGQIEQALADAGRDADEAVVKAKALTDATARAFFFTFEHGGENPWVGHVENAFAQLKRVSSGTTDVTLTVKIPEGFELYGLFPEQYLVTAGRWATEHGKGEASIIGIRTIGTALSAVVKAVLEDRGWSVTRMTVRPCGHPFARWADVPRRVSAHAVIIVDEGPGLSGSSMASVARACHEAGVSRDRIFFFPGSEREPGFQADGKTREWWNGTARRFTRLDEVRWRGKSLKELLSDSTRRLVGSHATVIHDLSGGAWREHAYADEARWPAVASPFERMKFKIETYSGHHVFWKFAGFGSEGCASLRGQLDERARRGWATAPLGTCCGFVATRWVEGERLTPENGTFEVLSEIARYIADVAGRELTGEEGCDAMRRLTHMMGENAREAGIWDGRVASEEREELAGLVEGLSGYGDGRMAPHDWIWSTEERLIKADAHDHSCDHTIVGRQPFVWDVAGTIVEWDLDERKRRFLIDAVAGHGLVVNEVLLEVFVRAYAMFRMGLMHFCAAADEGRAPVASDALDEPGRSRAAVEFYRRWTANLSRHPEPAATLAQE